MPQQPNSTFAPSIDVDDSRKWVLRLDSIEERESQFRDKRKDAMADIYKFHMYDVDTGVAVIDDSTGEMFELWKWTNDLTYDNPTTGKIAPGREIANALVGHRLTDDEVREMLESGWEESLKGKRAIADVEWESTSDGGQRLRLLRLRPYKKPQQQSRRKPADDEDDDE